ncbi:hypothetical protein, partial [Streptomyces sp. NPDC057363]|uniref:hypothetical protein n=1 Tax=Streptomyces sp. NPDC057363 TaxID=3346107 RepID=UPI00362C691F
CTGVGTNLTCTISFTINKPTYPYDQPPYVRHASPGRVNPPLPAHTAPPDTTLGRFAAKHTRAMPRRSAPGGNWPDESVAAVADLHPG